MPIRSTLDSYRLELKTIQDWKAKGIDIVDACLAGPKLADGREVVPIDEYLDHWGIIVDALAEDGIDLLEFAPAETLTTETQL